MADRQRASLREIKVEKKKKPNPLHLSGGGGWRGSISLTMSYFHTGIRTIIGAEAFHGPVRDGKEWDHLAMVIRLKLFASIALDN